MLSAGYAVTGSAQLVETYVAGKQTIGIETIGGLKVAYVLGTLDRQKVPAGIEVSRIDLQKLFVQMTTE
jgi:ABC-2 type transport system ATP-binding protein